MQRLQLQQKQKKEYGMPKVMKGINTIHRCQTIFRGERLGGELCGAHHLFVFSICSNPGESQEELAKRLYLNKSTSLPVLDIYIKARVTMCNLSFYACVG